MHLRCLKKPFEVNFAATHRPARASHCFAFTLAHAGTVFSHPISAAAATAAFAGRIRPHIPPHL